MKQKYSVNKIKKYPKENKIAVTNLMIANELSILNNILKNETNKSRDKKRISYIAE